MSQEILSLLESLGIGAIIIAGATFLLKKAIEALFSNASKEHEIRLQHSLEEYKKELGVAQNKTNKLHEQRLLIIAELYEKMANLEIALYDLTALVKMGSSIEEINERENKQMEEGAEVYNEFFNYYSGKKIYFKAETCQLIDDLSAELKNAINDRISMMRNRQHNMHAEGDYASKAYKTVREKVPPIMRKLEDEFRREIYLEQ